MDQVVDVVQPCGQKPRETWRGTRRLTLVAPQIAKMDPVKYLDGLPVTLTFDFDSMQSLLHAKKTGFSSFPMGTLPKSDQFSIETYPLII